MKHTKHSALIHIRKELLVRISFVLKQLHRKETNESVAMYLGVSSSTFTNMKYYDWLDTKKRLPLNNIDRMLEICEKLHIDYSFKVSCKNGKTFKEFTFPTVSMWDSKKQKAVHIGIEHTTLLNNVI